MTLSEIDRNLLQRCLDRKPRAWEDFVDRFMGLVLHVVNHSAQARGIRLRPEDRDDLASEVFLGIIREDFAVLRHFRGESSLATYLTVVARRIVVREILRRKPTAPLSEGAMNQAAVENQAAAEERVRDRDEIERMLEGLKAPEAEVVRMYHLESKSYREIGTAMGMSENSIGPILTRARGKIRAARVDRAPS